uniref:Uncharacterized protein n=1 Tax=Anguilla anguilla TaxID=7936 RepID=A0A0E9XQ76_ANGAN
MLVTINSFDASTPLLVVEIFYECL